MARVTVEDCLQHVSNRFDLVIMAARRTRQLTGGAASSLEANNDKPTVLALREIGENTIDLKALMVETVRPKREKADEEEEVDGETRALMDEETAIPGIVSSEDDEDAQPANDFSDGGEDEDENSASAAASAIVNAAPGMDLEE